jgi:catechol 2,3-dioxygenase-like lactoylglutathione lyase family enzyme
MPSLKGILETALYVDDLDRSQNFYQSTFGFTELLRDERMCALQIAESPLQVLLLFRKGGSTTGSPTPGGFIPPHDGNGQLHMAFSVDVSDIATWKKYLAEQGVTLESEVQANDGHSLYFRDPDGHCIELGTPGLWNVKS